MLRDMQIPPSILFRASSLASPDDAVPVLVPVRASTMTTTGRIRVPPVPQEKNPAKSSATAEETVQPVEVPTGATKAADTVVVESEADLIAAEASLEESVGGEAAAEAEADVDQSEAELTAATSIPAVFGPQGGEAHDAPPRDFAASELEMPAAEAAVMKQIESTVLQSERELQNANKLEAQGEQALEDAVLNI